MTANRRADASQARPVLTSVLRQHRLPPVFSSVPGGSLRRQPSEAVRFVAALVGVVLTPAWAQEASGVERDVYDFLTDLPDALRWLFAPLYWLLFVVATAILVAALTTRRFRLLLSMVGGASGALAFGLVLRSLVDGVGPGYPAIGVAVATGALLTASPYLTRPMRRWVESLIALGALGSMSSPPRHRRRSSAGSPSAGASQPSCASP